MHCLNIFWLMKPNHIKALLTRCWKSLLNLRLDWEIEPKSLPSVFLLSCGLLIIWLLCIMVILYGEDVILVKPCKKVQIPERFPGFFFLFIHCFRKKMMRKEFPDIRAHKNSVLVLGIRQSWEFWQWFNELLD